MNEEKPSSSVLFEIARLLLGFFGLQLLAITFLLGCPVYFLLKMLGEDEKTASQIGLVCGAGLIAWFIFSIVLT